jgi:hypothetical protein
MSRNGFLICAACRMYLPLGQYLRRPDGGDARFHRGGPDDPPNSRQPELTRALWKFHAEHVSHVLRTLLSGDPDFENIGDFVEIGGDRPGRDIPLEDYLRDWSG